MQNCREGVSPSCSRMRQRAVTVHVPCLQYCYEGVGMILPIESSMKERERFGPVLSGTIALITAIFLGFGAVSTLPANVSLHGVPGSRNGDHAANISGLHDEGTMAHMQPSQWILQQ